MLVERLGQTVEAKLTFQLGLFEPFLQSCNSLTKLHNTRFTDDVTVDQVLCAAVGPDKNSLLSPRRKYNLQDNAKLLSCFGHLFQLLIQYSTAYTYCSLFNYKHEKMRSYFAQFSFERQDAVVKNKLQRIGGGHKNKI